MAKLDLSQLKAETDETFESLDITDGPNGQIRLQSPFRLSDEKRVAALDKFRHAASVLSSKNEDEKDDEEEKEPVTYAEFKQRCVDLFVEVADKPEDVPVYMEQLDYAETIVFLKSYGEAVGMGKSKQSSESSTDAEKK